MEQDTLRRTLVTHLGHFPERVPLDLTLENTVEEEGYTRALVTYLVEANERIAAWLLTPHGDPPPHGWPVILAIHQHAGLISYVLKIAAHQKRYASLIPCLMASATNDLRLHVGFS